MRCASSKSSKWQTQGEELPQCAQGTTKPAPQFELHRQKLLEDLDGERRSFLKSAFVARGGAAAWPVLFLYELGALGLPWEPSLFSDEWLYGT